MKKFIKTFTAILCICMTVIFSLVIYGEKKLPDNMNAIETEIVFSGIYKATINKNSVLPVSKAINNSESLYCSDIKLFGAIPVKNINIEKTDRRYVAVGGELIGIRLKTDGVLVVGLESFLSTEGNVSPAEEAGIKQGDTLVSINGEAIGNNGQLCNIIEGSEGNELKTEIIRNGKKMTVSLYPKKASSTGQYKSGLWIRDSTGGIGTVTFADLSKGTLACLGHGIYDVDTGTLMATGSGILGNARLTGVTKGTNGTAGELRGCIGNKNYGNVLLNCENGIYGTLTHYDGDAVMLPVAMCNEVKTGKAQIISTVNGTEKQYFDIEIEKIDISADNKNMIIKVTDKELLELTGGIVQGMSGSPIVQNNMLVGAVTHVFLNNPAKGYAILSDKMLSISDNTINEYRNNNAA